jgi:hypothetical protein
MLSERPLKLRLSDLSEAMLEKLFDELHLVVPKMTSS